MPKVEKTRKRPQSIGEEIANAVSHGVMAVFGIVALVLLISKQNSIRGLISALIFGLSIFILFLMSTLYHALSFTKARGIFKRFDHLSIFILIGGTFAPALLLLPTIKDPFLGVPWMLEKGLTLFIIQWILITIGIVFKSIWVYKFQKFHFVIYLLLGWSSLTFIIELYSFSIPAFWLILAGGIAYSAGTIFYAFSKVKYFHFVWHIFVNIGAMLQFFAVYLYIIGL